MAQQRFYPPKTKSLLSKPPFPIPHKRGRTVILLTFESGLKLVYKPKDLGLEVAFNQFLDWCNQHSQLLDFKVIQVLNRDSYGWVEYVEHQPCMDEAAAKRFYQRAGMLLCVLYALRGTDCHRENLIASGEHLVLIDMEILLHHEANVIENSPFIQEFETTAAKHLWDSVLRTELLPRWDFSSDRRIAYDISGLGSTAPQQAPRRVPRWQEINTDNMHWRYEPVTFPLEKNVPRLGEIALSANNYQAQIAAGFEQIYRFLIVNKDGLLAKESPLAALQDQQVRFIFRATRIYGTILQNTWVPDYLKHGVDYSVVAAAGCELWYLPPYAPCCCFRTEYLPEKTADLNKIEHWWFVLKNWMKQRWGEFDSFRDCVDAAFKRRPNIYS